MYGARIKSGHALAAKIGLRLIHAPNPYRPDKPLCGANDKLPVGKDYNCTTCKRMAAP